MMELLVLAFIACPIVAITLSFVYGKDAESPLGDGMILGFLLLAVPLWPITMPFWAIYIVTRHRNAVAEQEARAARLRPAIRTAPVPVRYGLAAPNLDTPIPDAGPREECRICRSTGWRQTSPIRYRFGGVGTSFVCHRCGATRNFDIVETEWRETFQAGQR